MSPELTVAEELATAVAARERGDLDDARQLLIDLHQRHPDEPEVNLQCAWIHDKLGLEGDAVPFYEQAIEKGLPRDQLHGALLGLGSTYRALGRYEDSLATLSRGTEQFPSALDLQVFRAMALYNVGRAKDAVESLLQVLAVTPQVEEIARYQPAIATYAEDLDRTWA